MQQLIDEEGTADLVYKTRVADIQADRLILELPIAEDNGKPLYLPVGTEFMVTYIDHNNNHYHFKTTLVEKLDHQIPFIVTTLPNPDEIIKTQKRGFFRVEASLDLAVMLKLPDRQYHLITKTDDIGGGGLSFSTPLQYRFEVGDRLQLWCIIVFKEQQIKRIFFDGEVVRVVQPDNKLQKQQISIKFTTLKDKDSMSIMRYCFERQIEMHKFSNIH